VSDRPALADMAYNHPARLAGQITAALLAGGFTIPCDRCEGRGGTSGVIPYNVARWKTPCPKCLGAGVLLVGILPAAGTTPRD
jgi:hypothetical protein